MNLFEMVNEEASKLGLVPCGDAKHRAAADVFVQIYRDKDSHDKGVAVSISGLEEIQNSGDHLRDLVQSRVKNARLCLDALKDRPV